MYCLEENTQPQTLIQKLAEFSGEDLTNIDPVTGARTTQDTDADIIETDDKLDSPLFTRRKPPSGEQTGKA